MPTSPKKLIKDEQGFALIIIIMVVCLIVPITLQFNKSAIYYKFSAANLKYGAQVNCAARSGFHYALAILYEDLSSTEHDSLKEIWADPEALEMDEGSAYEGVKFSIKIEDLSGRVNINLQLDKNGEPDLIQQKILERLLRSLDSKLEDEKIGDIVNSIKDWIDTDDEVSDEEGLGAENSYYQGLSTPFSCKNAPLKNLEELRLIKGINIELYNKISKYLTIYGEKEININTADAKVLQSLSEDMDSESAGNMIEYRDDEKNDLSTANWYKSVQGMSDINLDSVTVSSTYFKIISTGTRGDMKKTIQSMLERKKEGTIRVLSQKID